jgi:hypothetical protein
LPTYFFRKIDSFVLSSSGLPEAGGFWETHPFDDFLEMIKSDQRRKCDSKLRWGLYVLNFSLSIHYLGRKGKSANRPKGV